MPTNESLNPNDHTRLAVLETKVNYIEETVKDTKIQLSAVDNKVDGISTHIAQQNGTLPRLEDNISRLLDRIEFTEKEALKTSTKTKITWGIISAIVTGSVLILLKILLGV